MPPTAASWPGSDVAYLFVFSGHPSNVSEEPDLPLMLISNNQSLHSTLSPQRQGFLLSVNYITCLHALTVGFMIFSYDVCYKLKKKFLRDRHTK